MPRFSKGTLDHDFDGKMGGSLKENDMTAPKKAPAKKPAAKADEPAVEQTSEPVEAVPAETPGLSPKEQRAKLNEQFAAADAKGQAAIIEETQVALGVRGY